MSGQEMLLSTTKETDYPMKTKRAKKGLQQQHILFPNAFF